MKADGLLRKITFARGAPDSLGEASSAVDDAVW